MNLVRRKRLAASESPWLVGGTTGQQRGREIREKPERGALRISNRSANRIKYFMVNVALMALTDHGWSRPSATTVDLWLPWTTETLSIGPRVPRSAETVPPVSTGDCDIARRYNVAETRKFRNFWSLPACPDTLRREAVQRQWWFHPYSVRTSDEQTFFITRQFCNCKQQGWMLFQFQCTNIEIQKKLMSDG